MATAAKRSRAARRLPRQASDIRGPDSMEFLVSEYEDRAVVAGLADLVLRRDVTGLSAEGGSFTSETVTTWQAPH
jgi:hypothetical protein